LADAGEAYRAREVRDDVPRGRGRNRSAQKDTLSHTATGLSPRMRKTTNQEALCCKKTGSVMHEEKTFARHRQSSRIYQDLARFRVEPEFRGRSVFAIQIWRIVQCSIFRCSPRKANTWRVFLLRIFGAKIGKRVLIRPSARIEYPWKLKIGDNSWIGERVCLYNLGLIVIGKSSVISQESYICSGSHDYKSPSFPLTNTQIHIGDEVWIAARSFVCPGVVIGDGSVVAACSCVTKNVGNGMIYGGNPARYLGPRQQ
jgi:putative colanic acid biosynthesis acetyltransferase WcaF